jgi:hypothetical protein
VTTEATFPSGPLTPSGIALGWFGEDGEWAVAEDHLKIDDFCRAVDEYRKAETGVDPATVLHAWAVLEENVEFPEDHDFRWTIRWNGITKDTPRAFAVTAVDTSA